ncbi:MAG TPA: site-specific integrase [Spirochaetia bacterium]|nr:site-specific integrase [Spirochaetia bacterium]
MENPSDRPKENTRGTTNPALVYLNDLARKGRFAIRGSLDSVAQRLGYVDARTVPWHEMKAEHVAALRSWLSGTFEPAVADRCLAALKGTLRVAWQLGQIGGGTYARILSVKPIRRSSGPLGRSLSAEDIQTLVETCVDGTYKGRRDLAVIALGYCGGLRRSEIAALDADDVRAVAETFMVRVQGKGGQERLVFIANGGADAIRDYLVQRGEIPGALFQAVKAGAQHGPRNRLTADGLFQLFRERAREAGIVDVTPHDLRRTFVSDTLSASPDTLTISALSGARNPPHVSFERKGTAAISKFPYRSREA